MNHHEVAQPPRGTKARNDVNHIDGLPTLGGVDEEAGRLQLLLGAEHH
jgi:hypothetical protein